MNLEYKLLAALRSPQNHHSVWKIKDDLFTDNRLELFEVWRKTLERFGHLETSAIEAIYQKDLPAEVIVPLSIDPSPLIERLHNIAVNRRMFELAQEMIAASKRGEGFTPSIKQQLQYIEKPSETDTSLQSGVSSFLADIGSKVRNEYKYCSTGLRFLDSMLGGEWARGEYTIISGATGGGKTALAGDSAYNMALSGKPVDFYSLEMPKRSLVLRWVSQITGIDARMLRSGRESLTRTLSDDKVTAINDAVKLLEGLPIRINDTPGLDATTIAGSIRHNHTEFGTECVFIDYLQIMGFDKTSGLGMHYALNDGLKILANIAKELHVPIIILAQRHKDDKRVKDVGNAVEHAAAHIDVQLGDIIDENTGTQSAVLEFLKNRHGPTGQTPVLYNRKNLHFYGNSE